MMKESDNNKVMVTQMIGIIVVYGALVAVLELFFAKRIIYSLIGLLIGCMLAVYMVTYINIVLQRCMELEAKAVEKYVVKHSIIRYFSVGIAFGLVCVTKAADPIACFIGLLGMKVSAYLQPVIQKLMKKHHSLKNGF